MCCPLVWLWSGLNRRKMVLTSSEFRMSNTLGYSLGRTRLLERGKEEHLIELQEVAHWITTNMIWCTQRGRVIRPNKYICAKIRRQFHRRQERIRESIRKRFGVKEDEDTPCFLLFDDGAPFDFKLFLSIDNATNCNPDHIRNILVHLCKVYLGDPEDNLVWTSPVTKLKYCWASFVVIVKCFYNLYTLL